jgi:hypothetical protein
LLLLARNRSDDAQTGNPVIIISINAFPRCSDRVSGTNWADQRATSLPIPSGTEPMYRSNTDMEYVPMPRGTATSSDVAMQPLNTPRDPSLRMPSQSFAAYVLCD